MAWYQDLAECDYFGEEVAKNLRAVGWLEYGKPFSTGEIDAQVFQKLLELRKAPWTSGRTRFRGLHTCDICEREEGMINLFIPAKDFLYVCPVLITHYISEHNYLPPTEFCAAVLNCPPMNSIEYKELLIRNGAETLLDEYQDL